MTIFNFVSLAGGLALFLYGMSIMGAGLEKASGGKLEKILEKLTNNVFLGVLFGLVVTAAIQSSSATTVIVVGFVNAGIMKLRQAVGVIMGANIGTTVTAQILRLSDVSGENLLLQILKPTTLAPLLAVTGILLFMGAKKTKMKEVGQIFLGFGILFTGMFAMTDAMKPLQESEAFAQMMITLSNPVLGVLVGALITAVIQSSSASVGILQAVSSTGVVPFSTAFPIIMGQNIGTCITPVLASIGASKNAKRAAAVHLYFNVIGTALFLAGVYAIQHFVGFSFWGNSVNSGIIANFHTVFNLMTTALFLPFSGLLARLAELTIKDDDGKSTENNILDERFLVSPALALQQCQNTIVQMSEYALQNLRESEGLLEKYDPKTAERINDYENAIDKMEDRLANYLIKLTERDMSEDESKTISEFLHLINEFERVGDYVINIVECAQYLYEEDASFSPKAVEELRAIFAAVDEILESAVECFRNEDKAVALRIEPLEEIIDTMDETLKSRHIDRLKSGSCSVDGGVRFLEILANLERIADHCSNIALYVQGYGSREESFDRHEYLREMHLGETSDYRRQMEEYREKYYARIAK